jgi:uncharacterized protein (DUF849 family)
LRKAHDGLKNDQVKRIKELEAENQRHRNAVSDLSLDKLILKDAASGTIQMPLVAVAAAALGWRVRTDLEGSLRITIAKAMETGGLR